MYRIKIEIINERHDELLTKQIKVQTLDGILDIDLPSLYAEAQQNELFDIGQAPEYDDTENYQDNKGL